MTGSKDMPGVIPLTVDDLFRMAGPDCSFEMQYFEIYNECAGASRAVAAGCRSTHGEFSLTLNAWRNSP